jgi:sugar (pentulose or hexulose) kinase
MSIGGTSVVLDPERDTLINVNAFGHPVPSARFMGGREYDLVRGAQIATPTDADREDVLRRTLMLLPAVVESSGPFPGRQAGWTQADRSPAETEVALGYYLALMASECLRLSGGGGPTLVEGPFASNPWFAEMLASATGRPVIASEARTGTAIGAALLFAPATASAPPAWAETSPDPRLTGYAAAWRSAVQ